MLSQKTTISFGLILAIIVVLSALFTMIAPNVVTKAELEASQKTVTVQITSICNRIYRLDTDIGIYYKISTATGCSSAFENIGLSWEKRS